MKTLLAERRRRILDILLITLALLAIVAYIPSAVLAYRSGVWSVLAVDTIAYVS